MAPAEPARDEIDDLIGKLSEGSGEVAEEAQASLTALGAPAAARVVQRLDGLSRLGKLCAIEILTAVPVPDAGPALTGLLGDADSTVREWAATALGELGHLPAVDPLRRLHRTLLSERVPLDWSEPVAVRGALRSLGARRQVVPPLLERHAVTAGSDLVVWPASYLERMVQALADAGQVLLFLMTWRRGRDGGLYWQPHDGAGWSFDWAASWDTNVRLAREAALLEASALPDDRSDLVVALEWIDAADIESADGH